MIKQIEEILIPDEVYKRIPYGHELYLQHLRNKSEIVLNRYKDTKIKDELDYEYSRLHEAYGKESITAIRNSFIGIEVSD